MILPMNDRSMCETIKFGIYTSVDINLNNNSKKSRKIITIKFAL